MSSGDNFDANSTNVVNKEVKKSCSIILRDLEAQDDISDGEYSSDFSVGANIDSDDEFGFSTDNSAEAPEFEDLRTEGSRMAVRQADSETDLEGYNKNRIFVQPAIKENEEKKDTRISSNLTEIDQLINEEMEVMEKEKLMSVKKEINLIGGNTDRKNIDKDNSKIQSTGQTRETKKECFLPESKPKVTKLIVQPTPVKPSVSSIGHLSNTKMQVESKAEKRVSSVNSSRKDIYPVLTPGTVNGTINWNPLAYVYNQLNMENGDSVSRQNKGRGQQFQTGKVFGTNTRKPVLYSHMIQSTIQPPRSGTPTFSRSIRGGRKTVQLTQQPKPTPPPNDQVQFSEPLTRDTETECSDSSTDSSPCHDTLPSSSSSSGKGPSSSEHKDNASDDMETILADNKNQRIHTLDGTTPVIKYGKTSKDAFKQPVKQNILHYFQKQITRCGHFIQRKIRSLSCTGHDTVLIITVVKC